MAQRRLSLILLAAGLGLAPLPARATPVDDLLVATAEALRAGDLDDVAKFVKRIDRVVPDTEQPVAAHNLALLRYYEGVARWKGDQLDEALDSFRACLALENGFQWDVERFPIDDAESVFEGLRREVASKPTVDLALPASTGASTLYVAGRKADPSLRLPEGRYLVQAVCPDGVTYGKWWKYGKAPNYESFCPGGFGEAAEPVADAGGSDVQFDEFGNPIVGGAAADTDLFGPPVETGTPSEPEGPEPPPVVADPGKPGKPGKHPTVEAPTEPVAPAVADAASGPKDPTEPDEPDEPAVTIAPPPVVPDPPPGDGVLPGGPRVGFSLDPKGVVLMGGGAGFAAVGAVLYFVWVGPAMAAVDEANANPQDHRRAEADGITRHAQAARWTTLGLLTAGVAGATSGAVIQFTGFTVTPWGVGLSGEF